MKSLRLPLLALASALLALCSQGQTYATKVESYIPGTGFTVGYTNANAALGTPSRRTADSDFGTSDVDQFDPPYLKTQLVSLGTNGSLTLSFDTPIVNRPQNPFGVDFIVFANAGFIITNNDFGGGGITDGSMFGAGAKTRVSVSLDGTNYYVLNPALAPSFDALFPTDGTGDFSIPVNPAFKAADLSGKTLTDIRSLYAGSGGGTGYDLAWAQDVQGHAVPLDSVKYVKLEVLDGKAEIDAVTVIPAPRLNSSSLEERFAGNPAANGWQIVGATNLFQWDQSNENLRVTWDSSKANSFFFHRLGTVLTKEDDFLFEFDLSLDSVAVGLSTNKPFSFELAIGFVNTTFIT